MTLSEMRTRLIRHSTDCVEKQLLLDVVVELDRLEKRIQHLVSQNTFLENELQKGIN